MTRLLWFMAVLVTFFGLESRAADLELPPFLPDYYAPAFDVGGQQLGLRTHSVTNGVDRWVYSSAGESLQLSVEYIECAATKSKGVFNNVLAYLGQQIDSQKGRIYDLEEREAYVVVTEDDTAQRYFLFRVVGGVQIWTFSCSSVAAFPKDQIDTVRFSVNHHRYEESLAEGNVAMGNWGNEIYSYASALLAGGQKAEAVKVLKTLIVTSPYNYQAHRDYAEHTADHQSAETSAEVVADNAEDEDLVQWAEEFLSRESITFEALPLLEQKERGLQVILIPLPPCSVRLLEESGEILQTMTGVPVKIARLREAWDWADPERFAGQRPMERILVQGNDNIDFAGWTQDRYFSELRAVSAERGAWWSHYIEGLIAKAENNPGQYRAAPYLDRLCNTLKEYASSDVRTMYVGVTEANIFSDGNNFIFSTGRISGPSRASVLSYHMMQAAVLSEDYAFRPRLAERLAKELVPATFKQIGIPRSTDPRCPYSYANGVSRLDEKTLQLSSAFKRELQNFRETP